MPPLFSPRPDTNKAMDEKISMPSTIQSFLWYLQNNTFEMFTKYAEIYNKLSGEVIPLENFWLQKHFQAFRINLNRHRQYCNF